MLKVTSLITRLQHTGYACLSLAGVKSRLLLTSTDSKHAVMHSSYTNRRGIEKVATDDQYTVSNSTLKGSQSPSATSAGLYRLQTHCHA